MKHKPHPFVAVRGASEIGDVTVQRVARAGFHLAVARNSARKRMRRIVR